MIKHNTEEKVLPARAGEIRKLVLGVVLALLVVNVAAVFAFRYWSYNDSYWLMHHKWRQLFSLGKLDWLVLGDSAGNSGIQAGLITEKMGRAYNFCIYGDALTRNDRDMLKAYIERYGAPKGVIMVHTYDVWHRVANPQVVAHTPIGPSRISEYTAGVPSKFKFYLSWALDRYVPLYAQASSFRQFIHRPHRLFAPRRPLDDYGFEAYKTIKPGEMEETLEEHVKFTSENTFQASQISHESMLEICRLAETHGFDVYFTLCPIWDGALANPTFRRYYDRVLQYLETFEASSPRFHLLRPFPITDTKENMTNVDHVTEWGARSFTELVMDRIREHQQEELAARER